MGHEQIKIGSRWVGVGPSDLPCEVEVVDLRLAEMVVVFEWRCEHFAGSGKQQYRYEESAKGFRKIFAPRAAAHDTSNPYLSPRGRKRCARCLQRWALDATPPATCELHPMLAAGYLPQEIADRHDSNGQELDDLLARRPTRPSQDRFEPSTSGLGAAVGGHTGRIGR